MNKRLYSCILCLFFVHYALGQEKKAEISTLPQLLSIGNSAIFYKDWYGVPCAFAPHLTYIAKTSSAKWTWGVNLHFCYAELNNPTNWQKVIQHKGYTPFARRHYWVEFPVYYKLAKNKSHFLFGLGASYQFRDEDRYIIFIEPKFDPNFYHHDLGINYHFHYLYDISRCFMLGLQLNANSFFKVAPANDDLPEGFKPRTYKAPFMAAVGLDFYFKIRSKVKK